MTRWQVPVVLGAAVLGTILGLGLDDGAWAERLVAPALVALLTLTFVGVDRRSVAREVRPHPRTAVASLVINFGWTPLLAGLVGWVFLGGHPDLRLGLVMLLVTPCTDWYLVFTANARGNVPLAAALLPPNLVLQLVLLPVFVAALTGDAADLPFAELARSIVMVLGIPLVVAAIVRAAASRAASGDRLDQALERSEPLALALLAVAIVAIFTAHARVVVDHLDAFARLLVPLAAFFVLTAIVAAFTAVALHLRHPERVTLTMTTLARNSPVALAIATTAFADRPLVAVALVVGPLVELPVLALAAHLLRRAGRDPAPSRTR